MKYTLIAILSTLSIALVSSNANAAGFCDEHAQREEICLRMNNLRAQIHALDAQRELMQVNPSYLEVIGTTLSLAAQEVLKLLGPGLPEHQMGLSGVAKLGTDLAQKAGRGDSNMMIVANQIRNQCATCHMSHNPPNGADWGYVFKKDWSVIAAECNEAGRNPYLCKSMNGILSAYSYNVTALDAGIRDYSIAKYTADEITRILVDLKEKNFRHVPAKFRDRAESQAREISALAAKNDPAAFELGRNILTTCMECHESRGRDDDGSPLSKVSGQLLRYNAFFAVKR